MSLISAGSISLDSTFKGINCISLNDVHINFNERIHPSKLKTVSQLGMYVECTMSECFMEKK